MSEDQHQFGPWSESTLGRGRGSIEVDGSRGEGGGQVLRTALSLALLGGRELRIEKIRAGRGRPGLLRQHLTAVQAAARIGDARVEGAVLHGSTLVFSPQSIAHGDYRFAVGTAGSATLVLQTVLLPLLVAPGRSRIRLEGGTHNPAAPTYDYLERVFFPCLRALGARIESRLVRAGFYPAGGGSFEVEVEGGRRLSPVDLLERGDTVECSARSLCAHIPARVASRELAVVRKELAWSDLRAETPESRGPGNVLHLEVRSAHVNEAFVAFGSRGRSAEKVAREAVSKARRYLEAPWAVGEHLADQLMLPMALVGGRFRSRELSRHAETNLALLEELLGVGAKVSEIRSGAQVGVEVAIEPA
jgi:RNA 3'-terminal phosphate cyclase (ATP)